MQNKDAGCYCNYKTQKELVFKVRLKFNGCDFNMDETVFLLTSPEIIGEVVIQLSHSLCVLVINTLMFS